MKQFFLFFIKSVIIALVLLFLGILYIRSDFGIGKSVVVDSGKTWDENSNKISVGPISVVNIYDGVYSEGYSYGLTLREQINDTVNFLHHDVFKNHTIFGFLYETWVIYQARKYDEFIPDKYRREMERIARGAGVSYRDILLINTFDDFTQISGCSSIVVPKDSINPFLLQGRNLDYGLSFLSRYNVITQFVTPVHVTSVGFPGFIGVVTGTNEYGITLSNHTVSIQKTGIGIPSGILYRMILDEAKTLSDAEYILKKAQRTIGNNLLVSSVKENKAVIFEITPEAVTRVEPENVVACTNHFTSEERASESKITPNSIKRLEYLRDSALPQENITPEKMKEILSFNDGNEKGWSSVANIGTVQSVIFEPENEKLFIAKGKSAPVTQGGYVEYYYSRRYFN